MHCFDGLTCVTVLCNEGWTTGVIGESPVILHTTENVRCFQKMFIFACLFFSLICRRALHAFSQLIFILPTIPCLFRFLSRRFSKDFAIFAFFFYWKSSIPFPIHLPDTMLRRDLMRCLNWWSACSHDQPQLKWRSLMVEWTTFI